MPLESSSHQGKDEGSMFKSFICVYWKCHCLPDLVSTAMVRESDFNHGTGTCKASFCQKNKANRVISTIVQSVVLLINF